VDVVSTNDFKADLKAPFQGQNVLRERKPEGHYPKEQMFKSDIVLGNPKIIPWNKSSREKTSFFNIFTLTVTMIKK
jgi:hypothetical protein